jgi:nitrogenase molybdenum-iron protein beta chain
LPEASTLELTPTLPAPAHASPAPAPALPHLQTLLDEQESPLIEWPRYSCALGAQQTVVAIRRAAPILHSGPGCSTKVQALIGQGEGYAGGSTIPCTNSGETEVIYGGESRLREVIDGSFKVIDADLYVVLTGCTTDIVGDDVGGVVGEYQLEGRPVVYVETGGFKSNNYVSHELVVNSIIDQYVEPNKTNGGVKPGLVNVFASVPYQDPFWNGNLEEYKRILEGIGLEVNILFGEDSGGVTEWLSIPEAQFNIVVGAWVGLEIARHLKELYGTPFVHFPYFPLGARDTTAFLRQVIDAVDFDEPGRARADAFIRGEERKFYAHIDTLMDFLLEFRYALPRRLYTLLDASYALGFTRFLLNEVGILPAQQFVLDNTPERYQEEIRKRFSEVSHLGLRSAEVAFLADAGLAHDLIRTDAGVGPSVCDAGVKSRVRDGGVEGVADAESRAGVEGAASAKSRGGIDVGGSGSGSDGSRTLIVGSSWERQLAADIGADLLIISVPVVYRLVLGAPVIGYRGAIRVIEDLYTQVLNTFR